MDFDEFEPWRKRMAQAFASRPDVEITKFSTDIGKSRDYIGRLINLGTANPPPTLFIEICARLGVSPAYIITGEDVTSATEERDQVVRRVMDADLTTIRRISRALDLFDEDQ